MFDHVLIAVSDLAASERFYRTVISVLGAEPRHMDAEIVEWADWDVLATNREHPVTRGLHVGFRAPSREAVDAFWQAGIDAGYRDDGAPGPRTVYGPDYYGGFLLDPDGNSAEAVHTERENPVPDGCIDHLWFRVRDPAASKRFYTTIAPHAGLRIGVDEPDHVQMVGENFSFSLIHDERPLTEHVHLAFPAHDDATVRAFHAAALAAGYEDHGGPGERASTTRATTARSSWTPTGTTSRSSTTTSEPMRRPARLAGIPGFGIDEVAEAAGDDPEVLRLENLDTDLAVPDGVVEATRRAVGADEYNSYLPFDGRADLKAAVAAHFGRRARTTVAPSQITITGGDGTDSTMR